LQCFIDLLIYLLGFYTRV